MAPQRVRKCRIVRPILIGNTARPLEERKTDHPDHTHVWTTSVKGIYGEDISPWIKKVIFKLHDTYDNPTRTIEKAPFEVTETGWGEFDIMVRIYFASESHEKSITYYHNLKLHPYGPNAEQLKEKGSEVNSWQYEEVVFNEPTEPFYEILTRNPIGNGQGIPNHAPDGEVYSLQAEQDEYDRLDIAHRKVLRMTRIYRDKLLAYELPGGGSSNTVAQQQKTS